MAIFPVLQSAVLTIGAVFLIVCGLVPKFGAVISSMPIAVLGGGVIVLFGMVAAAGASMLSDVDWNRRNMMIFAITIVNRAWFAVRAWRTATLALYSESSDVIRSTAGSINRYNS